MADNETGAEFFRKAVTVSDRLLEVVARVDVAARWAMTIESLPPEKSSAGF
jgi:hypothetical protein